MDSRSTADQHNEIVQLKHQLHALRQSVGEMEDLLDRYITAQQSLRQSEEQFRFLIAAVRDYAIFMLDLQGCILSWNTGAQLIKGYTADEIIGRHFSIFYPTADVAAHKPERVLQIAAADGVYKDEGWRIRKDGAAFWASVVLTALYAADGTLRGFGKVTRDLTEQKRAEDMRLRLREQALQIAHEQTMRAQAEADVRRRDAFLSSTAHELRTPVTAVLGYAQLLQRRFDRGKFVPEQVAPAVGAIAVHAQRLDRLTTLLLDITRLEHGQVVLKRASFDLRRGIERVVQELQLLTERHTLALELPVSPLMVEGDELRCEQALYNLVQNAIKYSPMGGTIRVTAQHDGQQVVITVSDEGMGIPAEDLPHVFDHFYRASNIEMSMSGLGLGLYLVKEYVTLQGGTVDVQSVVGQGTTFRVTLPQPGEQPAASRS